jgi:type IV pilus assembly protein PilB
MSRATPPSPSTPSGSPNDPKRHGTPQQPGGAPAGAAGMPAQRPNVTTPKAPEMGASAPPTAGGQPANKVSPPANPAARPNNPAAGVTPSPAARAPGAPAAGPSAPGSRPPAGAPAPGAARAGAAPGAPRPGGAPPAGAAPAAAGAAGGTPQIAELKGRPIGRILTKLGKVTREQVVEALDFQKRKGGAIGRILVDLGYIKEPDLNLALAAQLGYEFVSVDTSKTIPADVIKSVPPNIATAQKVLPIEFDPATKKLTVAMASHENFRALDDLRMHYGYNVTAKLADPETLEKQINKYYNTAAESLGDILSELNTDENLQNLKGRGESIDLENLKDAADSSPVRKLINLVLLQAIKDKASDIHFEPFEDEFKMRYRIDGVLYEMMPPPAHIAAAISSRIKVMANLDIAERRMPQDGRIELSVNNQPIDLRVSVLPTMFGESVVMRVLDRSNVSLDLDRLGMREDDLNTCRQLIHKPNGIVIVTGPTGSGKTTTLYSALRELNDISAKLITAEDPVEYDIDGIIQCQIKPEIEMTFGKILRSMLRQDPDTILVGEIRDKETAEISVQASLTGHLVFSTLHTNDAPSAIARLLDLGLEPFLVTATLEGIIAQRLCRKICSNCKEEYQPSEEQLMELELRPEDVVGKIFYYGRGCETCNNTGYKGRLGLYEIMLLDDDMRDQIIKHASTQVLRMEARKRGMRTLRHSGLLAIYDGITTIEEVVRETIMEEG